MLGERAAGAAQTWPELFVFSRTGARAGLSERAASGPGSPQIKRPLLSRARGCVGPQGGPRTSDKTGSLFHGCSLAGLGVRDWPAGPSWLAVRRGRGGGAGQSAAALAPAWAHACSALGSRGLGAETKGAATS